MEKRVLYICDYSSIYSGSFIKSMLKLRNALLGCSIDCKFVFPMQAIDKKWNKLFKNDEILFINLHGSKIKIICEIKGIIKTLDPMIVHAHFCSSNYFKLLTFAFPSVKFFVHDHSDFSSGERTIRKRFIDFITYKFLIRHMLFICVSKEFLYRNPKCAVYIPNGIVVQDDNLEDNKPIRMLLGISDDEVLCELFGWSPYVKGVDIAVEAIKKANEIADCSIKLAIVYGKNTKEEEIRKYIRNNTTCRGDEDFILFLPPNENVFAYHKASDIVISASRSEGFPYSVLEMLSIGKRCVISDIPGTKWASIYKSVVTFSTGDANDCAKAIIESIKKESYYKIVEQRVREDYSIEKWINLQLKLYGVLVE